MARRLTYEEKGKGPQTISVPPRTGRVRIPAFDTTELIRKHELTLMGRCVNPRFQRIWSLIPFLSDLLKTKSRPVGSDLGQGLFQFQFASQEDLQLVLANRPYHFAKWMLILQQWEPSVDPNFPSQIPFWIKVQGVPLHLWNEAVLRSMGEDLETYETCEILQGTMRMRVHVNGLLPLLTTYTLELGNGVEITVKLVYEKLEKHCSRCLRLDHEAEDCPETKVEKDVAQQRNHRQDSTNSNRVREAYTERREHDKRSTGAQNQCGYNPTRANSKNSHQTLGERHFPRDRRYESWSSKEHSREEAITKPYHRNQHAGDLFRNSREGERWVETGRRLHRSPPHREKTDTMERGRKSPSSHRGSRDADRTLSQSYRSKGAEISSESLHTPAANRGEFEGISEAIPEEVMAEARE